MNILSETFIIRLMTIVRRVARKFNVGLYSVQWMLSHALPSTVMVPVAPVRLANHLADEDLAPLYAMLPGGRNYGSSISENDLSRKDDYDLEIIIPAYNVEDYVDKCLQSVLNQQTKYTFLVVVVNDGSTDRTRQILAQYESCPNVEIHDQENSGLGVARNVALKSIRGRYIMFVDSDDWLLPGAVDVLMDNVRKYDADIVEGCFQLFDGRCLRQGYTNKFDVSDGWSGQLQGYSCGKVFRSELFAGSRFPEGYLYEDTLMTLVTYPMAPGVVTIPANVYVYRYNPMGITATSGKSPRAVEGLLVTLQLLEDNAASKRQPDMRAYDNFLKNEVPNTFLGIYTLNNDAVDHHVFSVFCRIIRQYFDGFRTEDASLKPFEKSLHDENYRSYVLSIMARET